MDGAVQITPSQPACSFLCAAASSKATKLRDQLQNANRVMVKVGTAVVSQSDGRLALSRMGGLVEEIADLQKSGKHVMLVSSGAVGVGRWRTGMTKAQVANKPENAIDRQVCAAAGQEILMSTYNTFFQHMGLKCAQVLITQGDFSSRDRYFALMDTITRLTDRGLVPIINENDVVTGSSFSSGPLVFKDNDMLASLVASGTSADALALMTDVEGVFNMPPDQPGAKRIAVYEADDEIKIGEASATAVGRGGMGSKIAAASLAASNGVNTIVASGHNIHNLAEVFSGSDIGTIFPPAERPTRNQRWLSYFEEANGQVTVRDSMMEKILADPAGVKLTIDDVLDVSGNFQSREPIALVDQQGNVFAHAVAGNCSNSLGDFMDTDATGEKVMEGSVFVVSATS
jgi:glutamate 5-kinase